MVESDGERMRGEAKMECMEEKHPIEAYDPYFLSTTLIDLKNGILQDFS
jgi:hypothetical protein